jgi:hypothetical protein
MVPENFWGDLFSTIITTFANGIAALLLGPLTLLSSGLEAGTFLTGLLQLFFPAPA